MEGVAGVRNGLQYRDTRAVVGGVVLAPGCVAGGVVSVGGRWELRRRPGYRRVILAGDGLGSGRSRRPSIFKGCVRGAWRPRGGRRRG